MTRVSGYNIFTTPCCGERYKKVRYSSMNFMAWEHWTDGYRGQSLMPNDHGLRKCACGNFYLVIETHHQEHTSESDLPFPEKLSAEEIPLAIASARTPEVELAARLDYWQHLNHDYRERYSAHRKLEEQATQAAWEALNPDTRTWWQRVRKVPAPEYKRPASSPFTYPAYELTTEQRANLIALQELLAQSKNGWDKLHLVEVHRELGAFDKAQQVLDTIQENEQGTTSRLLAKLVSEKETALIRYRMN